MNDSPLFTLFNAVLTAGLVEYFPANASQVRLVRSYNPTNAGRPGVPTILVQHLGDVRYGSPRRESVPDAALPAGQMRTALVQAMESTFQVNAMTPVDWTLEPVDLANLAAGIMQSDRALTALRTAGVSILRVRDVRNPKFRNDRDQYEASPSFDFTVTHDQIMLSQTPAAIVGELNVVSV